MKFLLAVFFVTISSIAAEEDASKKYSRDAKGATVLERLIQNGKCLKSALDLFANDNDAWYPSEETAKRYAPESKDPATKQRSLNHFLEQIEHAESFDRGITQFLYFSLDGLTDGKPLKECIADASECRFSYVKNLRQTGNTDTPVLLTPMVPGTLKFDPNVFGGKAIVICLGNALKVYDIGPDGNLLGEGENLFVHGKSVWENQPVTPERFQYPVEVPKEKRKKPER